MYNSLQAIYTDDTFLRERNGCVSVVYEDMDRGSTGHFYDLPDDGNGPIGNSSLQDKYATLIPDDETAVTA